MNTPDETAAVEAAIRWGQDYIDVRQGRAAGFFSVRAHVLRESGGRAEMSAAGGLFAHVVSTPAEGLDAIVVVYAPQDRLEVAISSWQLHCAVCGCMAGTFRAELM